MTKLSSCCDAVPVRMLPKKTVTTKKMKYFAADLLSNDDSDMSPSILDINISRLGSKMRNIFNASPGRKP